MPQDCFTRWRLTMFLLDISDVLGRASSHRVRRHARRLADGPIALVSCRNASSCHHLCRTRLPSQVLNKKLMETLSHVSLQTHARADGMNGHYTQRCGDFVGSRRRRRRRRRRIGVGRGGASGGRHSLWPYSLTLSSNYWRGWLELRVSIFREPRGMRAERLAS